MPAMALPLAAALLGAALPATARVDAGLQKGACAFAVEPTFPGYYWDPSCRNGELGCNADGRNVECRFCGGGDYESLPCPPAVCHFPNDPFVPYYWDAACKMGMLGCWADGVHEQCRFCGEYPYTSIGCPEQLAAPPSGAACAFKEDPGTLHYWEAACEEGMLGCSADGVNKHCRFCGTGAYAEIDCPASQVCTFSNEPTVPYYWDPECAMGKLGCMADGVHAECRFCAKRPFQEIGCPGPEAPPKDRCTFPKGGEPAIQHYWEPSCREGTLGCWADGIHAECRFCGKGVFSNATCPNATTTVAAPPPPSTTPQGAAVVGEPWSQAAGAAAPEPPQSDGQAQATGATVQTGRLGDTGSAQAAAANSEVARDMMGTASSTTTEMVLSGSATLGRGFAALLCWLGLFARHA